MAALILGGAGSILGGWAFGPIGAAIGQLAGAALGNMIDPQKVEGPRLTDLKLQRSQYGEMIPYLWGTKRLGGNVIDQTDLEEHSEESDGKGGPEVTTYSYTVSFMVQLCQGPIIGVPRIWMNGRLVHDQNNYNSQTSLSEYITLYLGTEDQLPDPTFEAVHGAGNVPAYRGYAYMVFTDFPVGDYGNIIPNIEFEVQTSGPETTGLRIVAYDTYQPIEWEWGSNLAGGPWGVGPPRITQWGNNDTNKVVVKNARSLTGHDYNASDLSYSGPTNYPGEAPPKQEVRGPAPTLVWDYFSIGTILIDGVETPLYLHAENTISAGQQNVALAAGNVRSEDGANTIADRNIGEELGFSSSRYIAGIAISQDKRTMLVLTAPLNDYVADTWHKVVNGLEVETGDVDPPIAPSMGYGSSSDTGQGFTIAVLENNGEWWWRYRETSGQKMDVFNIDPVTRKFAINAVAGEIAVADGGSQDFRRSSIYTMQEGYCGIVKVGIIAVVSRFPLFTPLGPPLSSVVRDLSILAGLSEYQIDVTSLENDIVDGYVIASQTSVRSSIGQLQSAFIFDAVESDAVVKFVKRGSVPIIDIPDDDLAAHEPGDQIPDLMTTTRQQEVELPRVLYVNHSDRETDYQQGTQYAERQVVDSDVEQTLALALVLTPSEAKGVAEVNLYNAWLERERLSLAFSRKYAYLEPTDVITARGRTIRLTEERHQPSGVIEFKGVPSHAKVWLASPATSSGSGFSQTLPAIKQPTDAALLDLPLIDGDTDAPGFTVAMSGRLSQRWKGAALYRSRDGGVNYVRVGAEVQPNSMGKTMSILPNFSGGNVFDEISVVDVVLTQGSPDLVSRSRTDVLNGGNLAVIGDELIQFRTATFSVGVWRLSGLLRGRYGTEWAMSEHVETEQFVLLPAYDYPLDVSDIGVARHYKAVTLGTSLATADEHPFTSKVNRLQPLSPVHLGGGTDASGNVTLQWTRRTRLRGRWLNVPLGQTSEAYVLQIWNAARTLVARIITGVTTDSYEYTAAMQVTDFGATQQTVYFSVGQVGAYGLGRQGEGTAPGIGPDNDAPLAPVAEHPSFNAPPPTTGGGSVDDNHMANFRSLFASDRQLAYRYTQIGLVSNWYQRYQNDIISDFFNGATWAWALWVQDAEYNRPALTGPEWTTLFNLALAAEEG